MLKAEKSSPRTLALQPKVAPMQKDQRLQDYLNDALWLVKFEKHSELVKVPKFFRIGRIDKNVFQMTQKPSIQLPTQKQKIVDQVLSCEFVKFDKLKNFFLENVDHTAFIKKKSSHHYVRMLPPVHKMPLIKEHGSSADRKGGNPIYMFAMLWCGYRLSSCWT